MSKHCPQLRQELKDIKTQFDAYILELEQAKENKDFDSALNLQKTLKQAIDQLKYPLLNHLYNQDPEAFKAKIKERLKLVYIDDFYEGRARVKDQSSCYFIDLDGKEITTARFVYAGHFQEGRAWVEDQSGYYFIDLGGKEITTARFEVVWNFYEGRALVKDQFGLYYIDLDGKEITTARFKEATSFYEGRAWVRDQSGSYHIDLDGKRIVDK